MTSYYGLAPVDFEHMTLREVSEYVTQMDRHIEEEKNGA